MFHRYTYKLVKRTVLGYFAFACFAPCFVSAQTFGGSVSSPNVEQEVFLPTEPVKNQNIASDRTSETEPVSDVQVSPKKNNREKIEFKPVQNSSEDFNIREKLTEKKEKQEIKLYMRNFEISKTLAGFIVCTMRFHVLSTLPNRISNISYRLKWPDMETPVIFDNVEPKVDTYVEYALLGKGCYNMDRTPNIIVNRCRVKDMTQETCASYIKWVK